MLQHGIYLWQHATKPQIEPRRPDGNDRRT